MSEEAPTPTPESPREKTQQRLQAAIGIAVSIGGLAIYVYLLGGLVAWLRFTAARLPADEALGSVDAKQMLAIGFKALVFVVVLLLFLAFVAWAAWRVATLARRPGQRSDRTHSPSRPKVSEQTPAAWAVLLLGIGLGIAVAPILVKHGHSLVGNRSLPWASIIGGVVGAFLGALIDEQTSKGWIQSPLLRWGLTFIAILLALVFLSAPTGAAVLVFVGLAHFGGNLSQLPRVDNLTSLIPAVLILGACAGLVVAAYLATPPVSLDRAAVLTRSNRLVIGGYVGRTSDGVVLARCAPIQATPVVSHKSHLTVVPAAEVKTVTVGGHSYAFDYGKNPSIIDLARYFFERDEVKELTPTASIDFRADRYVCGLTSSFTILGNSWQPRSGEAHEEIGLFGDGVVRLEGPAIASESTEAQGGERLWLPIRPESPAVLANLRKQGIATVEVRTSFAVNGEDPVTHTREVRIHLSGSGRRRPNPVAERQSESPPAKRCASSGCATRVPARTTSETMTKARPRSSSELE